jgi:hypothetical protein
MMWQQKMDKFNETQGFWLIFRTSGVFMLSHCQSHRAGNKSCACSCRNIHITAPKLDPLPVIPRLTTAMAKRLMKVSLGFCTEKVVFHVERGHFRIPNFMFAH